MDPDGYRRASAELDRLGFILESDPNFPSVVSLLVGERITGSWWAHPEGKAIWRALRKFASRRDVLATKLVSGKVALVHLTLWPDLLTLGTAREGWQTTGLPKTAAVLLKIIEEVGEITTTDAKVRLQAPVSADVLELERRLLVQSEQFHSAEGSHAKTLRSWKTWSRKVQLPPSLPTVHQARSRFELKLEALNRESGGKGRLLWE